MPIEKTKHPSDQELKVQREKADERISKERGGSDDHAKKPSKGQ